MHGGLADDRNAVDAVLDATPTERLAYRTSRAAGLVPPLITDDLDRFKALKAELHAILLAARSKKGRSATKHQLLRVVERALTRAERPR